MLTVTLLPVQRKVLRMPPFGTIIIKKGLENSSIINYVIKSNIAKNILNLSSFDTMKPELHWFLNTLILEELNRNIVIITVLHTSRNPKLWEGRLM